MTEPNELWQAALKHPATGQLEAVLYAESEIVLQYKLSAYVALQSGNVAWDIVPPHPLPVEKPAPKKSSSSRKTPAPS